MSDLQNDTPEFKSITDAERPELERQIREATPGATDADVESKAAELKASGIVVSSVETGQLSVFQKGEMRSVADALANLRPPAPKRETRAEQTARVLAERNAGGNPGPKPKTDAEAAARQARTDAYMAEKRKQRIERGDAGLKYHRNV